MQAAAIWTYIEKFSSHLASPQPATLFHYSTAESALGIVESGELWASAFQYLRDASEAKRALGVALYLVNQRLNELSSNSLSSARLRRALCDTPTMRRVLFEAEVLVAVKDQLESYLSSQCTAAVGCFSAKADDAEQWQRYCPQGGYALGFATDRLALMAGQQDLALLPCYYGSWEEHDELMQGALIGSMQAWVARIEEVYDTVHHLQRAWEQCKPIVAAEARQITATLLQTALLLRHENHRHEAEWRLLGEALVAGQLEYRERRGLIVPYQAVKLSDASLSLASLLQRVVVGTHGQRELARQGFQGLLSKHGLDAARDQSISCSQWQQSEIQPWENSEGQTDWQGYHNQPASGDSAAYYNDKSPRVILE